MSREFLLGDFRKNSFWPRTLTSAFSTGGIVSHVRSAVSVGE